VSTFPISKPILELDGDNMGFFYGSAYEMSLSESSNN